MAVETRDHQLTVRIPQRIRDALRVEADEAQRTVADVVNGALAHRYPASASGADPEGVRRGVVVPLDVAEIIIGVFLPDNERRMRNADPRSVEAVTEFKRVVAAAHVDRDRDLAASRRRT